MSRYAGMREDLVQASGGNSSCKIDNKRMLIKASGVHLADILEKYGYAIVDYASICKAFENCESIDDLREEDGIEILQGAMSGGARASIETFLYAITDTYTLHTHPIVCNALTTRKDARNIIGELFPNALFVDYKTPGIELAKCYFKAYMSRRTNKNQKFELIFLKNH